MDDLDLGQTLRSFSAGQKVFGRYALTRILGRGGMGVVWLAHDEKLEQDVALKFLPEALARDEEAIADLKRETRKALRLTHPRIVRIYDFVEDSRCAGISMEFVDGRTLTSLKLEQPSGCFSVATLRPWLEQLCEALAYAHTEAKVAHRDLKSANLMIDSRGDLKIADFGISATLTDTATRASRQASSSGTPVYMSPQQMMGEKPAATDDIYSLGATLYELLTGKPPFYSGNILLQVQNKVPPSITARREELGVAVAGAGGPGILAAWEETIAACLAKQPQDRPQSASEVWARLSGTAFTARNAKSTKSGQDGLSTEGTEGEESGRGRASVGSGQSANGNRKSKMVLVFGLAAVVALGGTVGWYYGIEQPSQRRVEEQRVAEIARQEEQRRVDLARQEQERQAEEKRQAEFARLDVARREEERTRKAAEERAETAARERDEQARLAAEAAVKAERERQAAASAKAEQERLAAMTAAAERARKAEAEQARLAAMTAAAERARQEQVSSNRTAPVAAARAITIPGLSLELVPIPAGSFAMGSTNGASDEKPVTQVELTRSFWLGKTEVTQTQWESMMGNNPSTFKGADRPVECVSYDDSLEFCRKLTARERAAGRLPSGYEYTLPTEAQWEYACRAGTTGDYAGSLDSMGWYDENSGNQTHSVAQKQANAWGLFDMHGNVWEWCADWEGKYSDQAETDPSGPATGKYRIYRGGAWSHPAKNCRSADRVWRPTECRNRNLGFRLALVPARSA